jgi:hypothetical protein
MDEPKPARALYVILDDSGGGPAMTLVEVEDQDGHSVRVPLERRPDGLWRLGPFAPPDGGDRGYGFPRPCRAEFARLSVDNPRRLLDWVRSREIDGAQLSEAAGYLGVAAGNLPGAWFRDEAIEALTALLTHPAPIVREGAIIGLQRAGLVIDGGPLPRLVRMLLHDPSPGVREAAADLFDVDLRGDDHG